jgi:HEAT repeat protein
VDTAVTPRDRAARLREDARADPDAVNPDAVLELLRHPSRPVQRVAAEALLPIVTEHPGAGSDAVARIEHLLRTLERSDDPDPAFGETLLLSLARIASADPEKALGAADAVLSLLDPDGPLAAPASACLTQLVAVRPGAFVHDVDQFVALLDAEAPAARRHAAHLLVEIGGEEPEAVRGAIPALRDRLDDDAETAQKAAVVLGQVARIDAAAVRPALPDLIDALDAATTGIRANAVGAVADVAGDLPKAVGEHQDALAARLDDEAASVRRNAAATLGRIADADVDLSESAHTGLVELLDDPDATVRATACQALGQLSSPAAAELLRATADEDEELAVRKAAERALDG